MVRAASRKNPKARCIPHANSRYFPTWSALNRIVNAWETLETGNHSPRTVEAWLNDTMGPAMSHARRVLGRKRPDGSEYT